MLPELISTTTELCEFERIDGAYHSTEELVLGKIRYICSWTID